LKAVNVVNDERPARSVVPAALVAWGLVLAAAAGEGAGLASSLPEAPPASAASGEHGPAFARIAEAVDSGLEFLARAQNPDGSVGTVQPHLQTGLAILAFLSSGRTDDVDPRSPIPAACRWLLDYSGEDGFLGDAEFPMESHAVCALALSELQGTLRDEKLAVQVAQRASRAVSYALSAQDKAVGAEFYGGWKADERNKLSDRRVTAWYLLLLRSASLRGTPVPPGAVARALLFMEGSQKIPGGEKAHEKADVGGFSYDATGLPVVSIAGAGLAAMSYYGREIRRRDLALAWLRENRPIWYGPNFYYTHFFTSRGLAREARRGGEPRKQFASYSQVIWDMLRDHQNSDGSFQMAPGNAENTRKMGKTYAAAMAVLILNAPRELLPVDAAE